ncbi:MAG: glycosyltransferase, partial [Patescibacteria group bacterium]|nr:glycosyltransferase [Patescibacteria group bacterium]
MKKILIIVTKGDIGGAQVSVLNLARELKNRGFDICVGFGKGDFLKNELKKENIKFVRFQNLKRTRNFLANVFFIFEIRKFLSKYNFDIVHFNSSNALFGAIGAKFLQFKPKTIFTFHGLSVLDGNYQTNKALKLVYCWFFRIFLIFIDRPVFVSQKNLDVALKIKLVEKGNLIYNGLNFTEQNFYSAEEAREYFQKRARINLQNKFIIGSIGRLSYAKNYEFLISTFPEILKIRKDAICLIIGEGNERKKYENLIRKLNLKEKVFLIGETKNAYQYLKLFNLFVLPSRYEGLPIVLIEALFATIPILASDVGGNSEILNNSKYQLYRLNDKNDFLNKFKNIANNKNICGKIANNNKIMSNKFLLK